MNEQQQYEKHLAEKFQQLPLPDVEPNWQQMKVLLDKEMPRGGGYWRWFTAFGVLLFMLGGTWLFISQQEQDSLAVKPTEKSKKDTATNLSIVKSVEKDVSNKDETVAPEKNSPEENRDRPSSNLKTKSIEENLLNNNSDNKNTNPTNSDAKSKKAEPENITKENRSTDQLQNDLNPKADKSVATKLKADRFNESEERIGAEKKQSDNNKKTGGQISDRYSFPGVEYPVKNATVQYNLENFISDYKVDKLTGNSIMKNYSGIFPESTSDNKQKSGKLTGKTKSAKPSALESVENRTLAVGFSLPMGFPLGDQKPGAYNINARPNTVSDFLPAPHMQYHINNKVYLQTELQFMNPQYIQPVLLFQNKTEYPSINTIRYNSIYAKKLYYFNIPVGIHYSPFPHFYLGTGLQFSSLLSGVALQEETSFVIGSGTQDLLSQRYTKFRNDTISNRIDNSEFRLMLDANYYWKQFTVGLRYNQALSNYVSFRLNNVSPLFTDKNKSLQFYLRYNLWEDYKRRRK